MKNIIRIPLIFHKIFKGLLLLQCFFLIILSPFSIYFKLSILFYSLSLDTSLYIFLYLFVAVLRLCCCAFSVVAVSRDYSSLQSGGFSCCKVQALGNMGLVAAVPGLQSVGSIVAAHRLSGSVARGIIPDQELNLCLLHWQADPLPLRHQGSCLASFIHSTQQIFFEGLPWWSSG